MKNKFVSSAYCFPIEVTNNNKIYLPDISILRNKRVKHIDVLDFGNDALFSQHRASPNVNITIREQNTQLELIKNLPLSLLYCKDDRIFINKKIDFAHSYLDTSALDLTGGNKTFHFVIWYDDPDFWNLVPNKHNRTEIHPLELQLRNKVAYFNEDHNLKNRMFQNIILSYPNITPNGNKVFDKDNVKHLSLTLSYKGKEFIKNVPLELFYQNDTPYALRLQNIKFDLTASYIEVDDKINFDEVKNKSVFFNAVLDSNDKNIKL